MFDVLKTVYDFLTSPSHTVEGYKYLPYHGAILPLMLINITFALLIYRIGPWFMRNREPYNLKRVILFYDAFQILYNLIMALMSIRLLWIYANTPRGFGCILPLPHDHPAKSFETFIAVLYLINKFIDYMETIFFVLRKKYKQVTLLHVYHHILMTSIVYIYFREQGIGGHLSFGLIMNTFVHTIMYVYYLSSSLSERIKKSLWWKKYITQIQLLQFAIGLIHQAWPLLFVRDCPFPKTWIILTSASGFIMTFMFINFYYKTYVKQSKIRKVN